MAIRPKQTKHPVRNVLQENMQLMGHLVHHAIQVNTRMKKAKKIVRSVRKDATMTKQAKQALRLAKGANKEHTVG